MKTELGKWNPFKFLRKTTSDKQPMGDASDVPATRHGTPDWPDVSRLFSSDPWRAMGEFLHEPFAGFGGLDRWFGDFSSSRFQPRIDVVDDGEALRITAELPGMDREDLQATIEDGALLLRGEKKQDIRSEENGCYRLERAYGAFMRSIPLPDGVDVDHVDAKFDRGLLTLRLPKTGSSQSAVRTIEVK
ncbi:Hsp20/alpha crystallin family protein [Cupriavidus sp. CV2]|uniref:Hsp20/alpha crystallin family protein n=1 Tax=Cupriavidus ulmosensis TaxID=3065913 RepID=UPI00296AF7FB|nr:Hsp20/alpha crystallin family protein [Cupriavidus sp. CV2]MDW3687809.1 Hsp20/alpha crystallin family protein [Cupriavidus sp. CV2]